MVLWALRLALAYNGVYLKCAPSQTPTRPGVFYCLEPAIALRTILCQSRRELLIVTYDSRSILSLGWTWKRCDPICLGGVFFGDRAGDRAGTDELSD
jgi:hypothetical protein